MSNSIVAVTCSCGKVLKAKREAIGKSVRCPACKQPVKIQDPSDGRSDSSPAPDDPFSFLKAGGGDSSADEAAAMPVIVTDKPAKPKPAAKQPAPSPATPKPSPAEKPSDTKQAKAKKAKAKKEAKKSKLPDAVSFDPVDVGDKPAEIAIDVGSSKKGPEPATSAGASAIASADASDVSSPGSSDADEPLSFSLADPVASGAAVPSLETIDLGDGDGAVPNVAPASAPSSSTVPNQPSSQATMVAGASSPNPYASSSSGPSQAHVPSESRYPMLRLIQSIYRVLAFIVMIGSLLFYLGMVGMSFMADSQAGLIALVTALPMLISGAVMGISMLAFSELIQVLLDIQDNTRRTADRR